MKGTLSLVSLDVASTTLWIGDLPNIWQFSTYTVKSRTPRRTNIEWKQSLDVERWLKSKFREGCNKMRYTFEDKDPESKGVVCDFF